MATNEDILAALSEIRQQQKDHTKSVNMLTVAITGSVDGSVKGLNQIASENRRDIDQINKLEEERRKITIGAIVSAIGAFAAAAWAALSGGGAH